ncbi:MAG: type I DNA topoisomerase [Anaerolineae bacterium]|nr:type I DNA topoisomerase [Anaerolineae bacterium]
MSDTTQGYCVKCREKREMLNPTPVFSESGRPGVSGTCPVCDTKMFRVGRTEAHDQIEQPALEPKPKVKTKAKAKGKTAAKGKTKVAKKKKSSTDEAKPRRRKGKLVIVESPAKARTVGRFLGDGYVVKASKGHVRDLLVTQLSVDVQNNFQPKYRVPNEKRDTVKELKRAADSAEEIYLATDPDREGEAIAWHLLEAAEMEGARTKRVVFHEITDSAVQHAFQHPRNIDMSLVNAQQARRILDRIVGYNITELLWDRVRNRLSAGRVQSIALRMVVDREREIEQFITEEYWTLDAELRKQGANGKANRAFLARLMKIRGEEVAFTQQQDVLPHLAILEQSQYWVTDVKRGTRQRKPSAPFTTSTLQQEASRRFGFSAKRTMKAAQDLYEGIDIGKEGVVGLITYMRTDSTSVSPIAQKDAREYVQKRFGADYLPERAPLYRTKTKGAQEAHEAIRPTSVFRAPKALATLLSRDQHKLYTLIWERFIASQMANAIYDTLRVEIGAGGSRDQLTYEFRVSGRTIKFPGFLALYEDARDEDLTEDGEEGRILPEMSVDELLNLVRLLPEQHFTQPPPRYTEASLVRVLEEYGIGRPSTYAPTVAVIQDRDYVEKVDKRLVPSETGKIVNDLLVTYFPEIMNYQFTAKMEEQLDDISEGKIEWQPMLEDFYKPFEHQMEHARETMPRIEQEELIGRDCPVCGKPLLIRYGRFGKFIGCSDYPNCKHTEPYLALTGVLCPRCGTTDGGELVERKTRRGRTFYGCSRYPSCEYSSWKLPKLGQKEDSEALLDNESAR